MSISQHSNWQHKQPSIPSLLSAVPETVSGIQSYCKGPSFDPCRPCHGLTTLDNTRNTCNPENDTAVGDDAAEDAAVAAVGGDTAAPDAAGDGCQD